MKNDRAHALALLLLASAVLGADEPVAQDRPKDGLSWVQPSPVPPAITTRTVRGTLAGGQADQAKVTGDLAGLRAVALREGGGTIALGRETRSVKPGDRIGESVVKAVGADRIVLERPARPASGSNPPQDAATIVITFGPGGEPRVRTYVLPGAMSAPPEVR